MEASFCLLSAPLPTTHSDQHHMLIIISDYRLCQDTATAITISLQTHAPPRSPYTSSDAIEFPPSVLCFKLPFAHIHPIWESSPAAAKPSLAPLSSQLLDELSKDRTDSVQIKCTGNASAWATSELEETYAMMTPSGTALHLDRASFDKILRDTVDTICAGSVSLVKSTFISIDKVDDDNHLAISVKMASDDRKVYHSKWVVDA
ncbi:hypothetical protein DEU56DRAFT_914037 [Suillus clintonianus]|uniref:uncharacterized protein n=1 Tax=Suillus clintonianus TaxID=1904413 RepID=UPI001B879424|nr:uncharacterized protein DEU56DRAFT_914037 [Suillus clintonianus]KAG2133013.1 hypothetical protein DEU56DRAFT_914037 [Suillus clintonianus]